MRSPFDNAVEALKRQDYSTALQLLKPLAETGDSAAQNNLGVLYRNGQGTRVDHVEALKWFRRSADQRNASAEYNLGLAYAAGFGVAVNKEEASRWFKLSAEQGDLAAQTALGIMYYEGTGVPKNKAGGIKWLMSAAEAGYAPAKRALAAFNGEPVQPVRRADRDDDLSRIEFLSSTAWYTVDNFPKKQSPRGLPSLTFRKFYIRSIDGEFVPGVLDNIIFLECPPHRPAYLVIHIPDDVIIRTIGHDEWISETELRVLIDNASMRLTAEYVKGDFFIDFTRDSVDNLIALLMAKSVTVEFGEQTERISIYTEDKMPDGKGNLQGFLDEMVPMMLKLVGGKNTKSYVTATVLRKCSISTRRRR